MNKERAAKAPMKVFKGLIESKEKAYKKWKKKNNS